MDKATIRALAVSVLVAALHAATSGAYLDHPVTYDEMYHYLAAESWHSLGYPRVLDGTYARGYWYTYLVSGVLPLCDGSLPCLRATSLLASSLLVFCTTLFTCRYGGVPAGAVAGAMLAISPPLVFVGHYLRFYAAHALLIFATAALVFQMTEPRSTRGRLLRGGLAVMLIVAALHLQVTTLVALAGIAVAAVVVASPALGGRLRRMPVPGLAAGFGLALLTAVLAFWLFDAASLVHRLRSGPQWSAKLADYTAFYHHSISLWYPVAWGAAPLLVLAGAASRPRLVIYCATIFVVAFSVMSAGYTKGVRFIAFAMPFLCIALGIGLVSVVRMLRASLAGVLASWPDGGAASRRQAGPMASLAVAAAIVVCLANQPLVRGAQRAMTEEGYVRIYGNYASYPRWRTAAPAVLEHMREPRVVVTTAGVIAAYVVGDFSFDLNTSTMRESETGGEFGIDPRTGRPTISAPESLRAVLATCGPAIAIIDRAHAEDPLVMPPETLALLESLGSSIEPPGTRIRIWLWDHPARGTTVGPGVPCRPIVGKARVVK